MGTDSDGVKLTNTFLCIEKKAKDAASTLSGGERQMLAISRTDGPA